MHIPRKIPRSGAVLVTSLATACQTPPPAAAAVAVVAVDDDLPGARLDPSKRLASPAGPAFVGGVAVEAHCILGDDGDVSCAWGDASPIRVANVGRAMQIVAGHEFACALARVGRVACFRTGGIATSADRLVLPFRVQSIAASEHGIVLQDVAGAVHDCRLPLSDDFSRAPLTTCELVPLDVPDVHAYVDAWLYNCTLDRARAPSCTGVGSENDPRAPQPIDLTGFPRHVRKLVSGLGSFETGPVVCAIGTAGELACFRSLRPSDGGKLVAEVHTTALPGPVRDFVIGASVGRALLEDGRVYAIPLSVTQSYPPGVKVVGARRVATDEPSDAVTGGSWVRYRSGRVVTVTALAD